MTMFRSFATAAVLGFSALSIATVPASAAPCRDAHGKFIKCPEAATSAVKKTSVTTKTAKLTPVKKTATTTKTATKVATSTSSNKAPAKKVSTKTETKTTSDSAG